MTCQIGETNGGQVSLNHGLERIMSLSEDMVCEVIRSAGKRGAACFAQGRRLDEETSARNPVDIVRPALQRLYFGSQPQKGPSPGNKRPVRYQEEAPRVQNMRACADIV